MKKLTIVLTIAMLLISGVVGIGISFSSSGTSPSSGWGVVEQMECGQSDYPEEPQVAMDPYGNAIAVWEHLDGTNYRVLSKRYTNGVGWGAVENIGPVIPDYQGKVRIAIDGSGNAIAIWQSWTGIGYAIFANRYTFGVGWGSAESIESFPIGSAGGVEIDMNPSGLAFAVWPRYDGALWNLWSSRYVPGTGWEASVKIETDDSGDAGLPQIFVNPSGMAMAIWQQYDGTRYNVWSNMYTKGVGWGDAEKIEFGLGGAGGGVIAIEPSGNALAVWMQMDETRYNLWSSRFTMGPGWGTPELVETDDLGDAYNPKLALDPSDNVIAVWRQRDTTRFNVWSNVYVPGDGWGTPEMIETAGGSDSDYPQVAVDASGNAVAVWGKSDGTNHNVWSNRYVSGVGWGTAEMVEGYRSGDLEKAQVAVDPSGNAFAIWSQDEGTGYTVLSSRFIAPDTEPPSLTLWDPEDQIVFPDRYINVTGETEPGASVSVDGISAFVDAEGFFSLKIALENGPNFITVTAIDASGNIAFLTRTVHYSDPVSTLLERMSEIEFQLNIASGFFENITTIMELLENLTSQNISIIYDFNYLVEQLERNITDAEAILASLRLQYAAVDDNVREQIEYFNETIINMNADLIRMKKDQGQDKEDIDKLDSDLKMMTAFSIAGLVIAFILIFILFLIVLMRRKVTSLENEDEY